MTRWIKLWIFASLFFGLAAGPARAGDAPEALTNFEAAKVVIGQKNFTSSKCNLGGKPTKDTLCGMEGAAALGKNTLYVPDSGNARVLGFKGIPKKNGASAKLVLGQANFSKIKFGATSKLFDYPSAVVTAGNQLLMTDFGNSRVLIWNKLPTKTNTPAAVVVGQPDLTSNDSATTQSGLDHPELGLFVAGGKLFVSDRNNNRVMIWNSVPSTNGANADVVIGQPNFTSKSAGTTETSLNEPEGIWSDGTRLVVADEANNRVLIWNSIPTSNGAPADVVVGQADFTSSDNPEPPTDQSLNEPSGVAADGSNLYVEDWQNNRILVYSPFPTSNNPAASIVLGQADFTHGDENAGNASPSAQTLFGPYGLSVIGSQLIVNDFGNNRYLIFNL
ncbi:MAG: NHL repeat-containing protein [Candidatus Binatus sp.]